MSRKLTESTKRILDGVAWGFCAGIGGIALGLGIPVLLFAMPDWLAALLACLLAAMIIIGSPAWLLYRRNEERAALASVSKESGDEG